MNKYLKVGEYYETDTLLTYEKERNVFNFGSVIDFGALIRILKLFLNNGVVLFLSTNVAECIYINK